MSGKNKKFLIFICIVALIGGVNIAISAQFTLLVVYAIIMAVIIPMGYFNYELCKWSNHWSTRFWHRNAVDPEPSDLKLLYGKVTFWICYFGGLFLSLISTFL